MEEDKFPGFDDCMRLMLRRDSQSRDDCFWLQHDRAHLHVPESSAEFRRETDHGLHRWLLELLGEALSEEAYPILLKFLGAEDESLRDWAMRGLRKLDSKEARRVLWASGLHPRSPGVHRERDGA